MKIHSFIVALSLFAASFVLVGPSPALAEVNLLQNPGFEDGTITPWIGTNWTVTSSDSHSGTYSAECTQGSTIRQFVFPVDVSDVLEISIWTRSVDEANFPVNLLYNESGGDWDEFLIFPSHSFWEFTDLTSNLRSSGTLYGILVYGHNDHVVRLDDTKIMVDDAVAIESSAWGQLKALYR